MGCSMLSLISLIIGILIILISIIFIVRQSNSNNLQEEFLQNDDQLIITIESLENIIYDINHTFNSTINEIEKKYELLESKIHNVDKKVFENFEHNIKIDFQKDNNCENNLKDNIDEEYHHEEQNHLIHNKYFKIMDLKNKGLNAAQIAKELNMGTGEVILILNLIRARS